MTRTASIGGVRVAEIGGDKVLLCLGGEPLKIVVLGREYYFEWHHYCGPAVVGKRSGDPLANQPSGKSPFWTAVQWWFDQGRKADDDGFAVWEPEPEPHPIRKHLGGRHYEIVGYENKIPEPFDVA